MRIKRTRIVPFLSDLNDARESIAWANGLKKALVGDAESAYLGEISPGQVVALCTRNEFLVQPLG